MKQTIAGFPAYAGYPPRQSQEIKIFANETVMNVDQLYAAADDGTLRFCNSPIDRKFLGEYTESELKDYISAFVFEVSR